MAKFSQLVKKKEVWEVVFALEGSDIEGYTLKDYGDKEFLRLEFFASIDTIYNYGHFRGALKKKK